MTDELISRTTRGLFRNLMTGRRWARSPMPSRTRASPRTRTARYEDSSVRRQTTQAYLEAVDWSDPRHVARALRVFGRLMHGYEAQYTEKLRHSLRRDGYVTDAVTGHIMSAGPQLRGGLAGRPEGPSAIREQLDRIQRAIADDPALAVGSAEGADREHRQGRPGRARPDGQRQGRPARTSPPGSAGPRPPPVVGGAGPGQYRGGQAHPRRGLHHRGRARRAAQPRLRHRSRRRRSTGRPAAPSRAPRSQRGLHLVPADARHARRPRSAVAPRTQELTHPQRQSYLVAATGRGAADDLLLDLGGAAQRSTRPSRRFAKPGWRAPRDMIWPPSRHPAASQSRASRPQYAGPGQRDRGRSSSLVPPPHAMHQPRSGRRRPGRSRRPAPTWRVLAR